MFVSRCKGPIEDYRGATAFNLYVGRFVESLLINDRGTSKFNKNFLSHEKHKIIY